MFTGTMIEDLMATVQRVESETRSRLTMRPPTAPAPLSCAQPTVYAFPAQSAFLYEWRQEIPAGGVA
jgi:hypothetical protein